MNLRRWLFLFAALFAAALAADAKTVPITLFSKSGPPFSPSNVAGLTLWFDASNAGSITQSSGSVSQWNDLSGGAHNLTQATTANMPTLQTAAQNGLNTIRFTGANSQKMALPGTVNVDSAYSLFAVLRYGGPTGSAVVELFNNSSNISSASFEWGSNTNIYEYNSSGYVGGASESSSSYNQVDANMTSILGVINFNGTQITSAAPSSYVTTAGWNQIGYADGTYCNCEIAEIVVYDSVISSSNASSVRAYLKTKWGTP